MNSAINKKIIGFTISRHEADHSDVDVFGVGIKVVNLNKFGLNIYFWGIGKIEELVTNKNTISLSFPQTLSLEDRNVIITFGQNTIEVNNDWLGSIPVFYNLKTQTVSTLINKVIEDNPLPDPEGFNNYLDFGYSVFEQTPVKDVMFMRFYSKLIIQNNSEIKIIKKQDKALEILSKGRDSIVQKVIENTDNYINNSIKNITGNLTIPTSGGYDSRLLNFLIKDRNRIRAYSYGISEKQEESFEVIKAKTLAQKLRINWKRIELSDYNKYFKEWFSIFGCSTHLHGMYHMEFYKKIRGVTEGETSVLSGIIGDLWSGSIKEMRIQKTQDVYKLGYTHNINYNSKFSKLRDEKKALESFFEENKVALKDERFQMITIARFKIVLLSYLMSVPDYLGMPSWTPFLNMNIVESLLNLSKTERDGRKWETDFFSENNLDIESKKLIYSKENSLNTEAMKKFPIPKINIQKISKLLETKNIAELQNKYYAISEGVCIKKGLFEKIADCKYTKIFLRRTKLLKQRPDPISTILVIKSLEMTFK